MSRCYRRSVSSLRRPFIASPRLACTAHFYQRDTSSCAPCGLRAFFGVRRKLACRPSTFKWRPLNWTRVGSGRLPTVGGPEVWVPSFSLSPSAPADHFCVILGCCARGSCVCFLFSLQEENRSSMLSTCFFGIWVCDIKLLLRL